MEFLLLGPLEVRQAGRRLSLGPRRAERCLLGLLLLEAGRLISVDRLADLLWDGDPPDTARNTIQSHISRLRSRLDPHRDGRDGFRLLAKGMGYQVQVDFDRVDAHRFRAMTLEAQGMKDPVARAAQLRRAVGLWRGPVLADVASDRLRDRVGTPLVELKLQAWEACFEAELEMGRHREVVAELIELVEHNPLRERLIRSLMIALDRDRRRSDALEVYRRARDRMAEATGLSVSPQLAELHDMILREDGGTVRQTPPPTFVTTPRELPSDVPAFTGRSEELKALDTLLEPGTAAAPVIISAISGMGGVGKTALAVHCAHRMAWLFPDGQLYVDLQGYSLGKPTEPLDALTLFLRALGVTAEHVPAELSAAVKTYRSLTADRRMLIVLDNALDPSQVRPLLPGGRSCAVLITSRDRLNGLVARDGARPLIVDALSDVEARELLSRVLEGSKVVIGDQEITELLRSCANLPLAVRIAAASLAASPDGAADYLATLRTEEALAKLEIAGDPETSMRNTFSLSYRALSTDEQKLFRLLGLWPGPDIGAEAAAALAQTTPRASKPLLDKLVSAHLVLRSRPHRYGMHDLLGRYARELAEATDDVPTRVEALRRLGDFYLATVDAAAGLLYPAGVRMPLAGLTDQTSTGGLTFDEETAALAWLDDELHNLVPLMNALHANGIHRTAWLLADALRGYFWIRRHAKEWFAIAQIGLDAAASNRDDRGRAAAHLSLALAYRTQAEFARCIEHAEMALTVSREVDWAEVQSSALSNLGVAYTEIGDTKTALRHLTAAHGIQRLLEKPAGQVSVLTNMSTLRISMGDLRGSSRDALNALNLCKTANNPGNEALAHYNAGYTNLYFGQFERADKHLVRGYELYERIGERYGQSLIHNLRARLDLQRSDHHGALSHVEAGIDLAREIGDSGLEAIGLADRAIISVRLGQSGRARQNAETALRMARAVNASHTEVEALTALAKVYQYEGRHAEAVRTAEQALELARKSGHRLLEADALITISAGLFASQELHAAVRLAQDALTLYAAAGSKIGEDFARAILGTAFHTKQQ